MIAPGTTLASLNGKNKASDYDVPPDMISVSVLWVVCVTQQWHM